MTPNHYYNRVIKRYYTVFGALFSNIKVKRYKTDGTEEQEIHVPVFHAEKQRFLARYDEKNHKSPKMNKILPRMGFQMVNFEYDHTRATSQRNTICFTHPTTEVTTQVPAPVPYNFFFELNLLVQYMDDGLQILEQILPYFQPNLSVPIIEVPEMDIKRDINIVLDSVDPEFEVYDELFNDKRNLAYTMRFKLEGYIYPATSQIGLIESIALNFDGEGIFDDDNCVEVPTP